MAELVKFPSNGTEGQGYLALPDGGAGRGVVVLQEWWGLNDQIKEVCDRFATEGFVALAPDIYRGVETKEPDEAAKLMMSLNIERAAKDMVGAVHYLAHHEAVTSDGVGVVGFCMGGGLALWLGTLAPTEVAAVVPFYGVIPWEAAQPDYSALDAPVQGHYAEVDDFAGPPAVAALEATFTEHGKTYEFFMYEGTEHAFANHHRPEVFAHDEAELAWERTLEFLRASVK
jgi:carboxymethylenebutenolidase